MQPFGYVIMNINISTLKSHEKFSFKFGGFAAARTIKY